ncbi:hypothetical protein Pmani_034712, partial [Petrolisthes manimaculis]
NFKCEVLADHPSFEKDSEITYMEVVDEPKQNPKVSLERLQWSPGEVLKANCTSPVARPPSDLNWFINGEKVSQWSMQGQGMSGRGLDVGVGVGVGVGVSGMGSRSRSSQLNLVLRETHFTLGGQAVLSCDATYKKLYSRTSKVHLIKPGYKTAAPSQKLYGEGCSSGPGVLVWILMVATLAAFTL